MAVWAAHETEQLINLVRRNQTIYDPSSNDYRNREVLKILWNNIAREMNKSGRIFISDMDCRDRWNSLRDGYRRFVKDEQAFRNGSKAKKKKTWHWSEAMSFLKPYVRERTSSISVAEFDSNVQKIYRSPQSPVENGHLAVRGVVETNNELVGKTDGAVDESRVGIGGLMERGESGVSREDSPNNECGGKWNGTSAPVKQASSSPPVAIETPTLVQDSDEQFFRSLLPDVKVLSPRQRGIFKIQVQQLLQEMLYPKDLACTRMSAQSPATVPSHVNYGTNGSFYPSERWSVNIQSCTSEYRKPHPS